MADGDRKSLSLPEVVQRFSESERALGDLSTRIGELGRLREDTAAAARALKESAGELNMYVEEVQRATAEAGKLTRSARELLEQAGEVLDNSQLHRIEELAKAGAEAGEKNEREIQSLKKDTREEILGLKEQIQDFRRHTEELSATLTKTTTSGTEKNLERLRVLDSGLGTTKEDVARVRRTGMWMLGIILVAQAATIVLILFR